MGRRWVVIVGCLWACGPGAPQATDGPSAPEDAGGGKVPVAVELGVGRLDFEPLLADQVVEMERGPQSLGRYYGYHFWLAVRAQGLDPEGISVAFIGTTTTATVVDTAFQFDLQAYQSGYEAHGFRGLISDCCLTRGRAVTLALTLVDQQGRVGQDRRTIRAATDCWVPEGRPPACPD